MKLMPQTLHGHVLHETADAKKQQAGQQLVHEAPQWVGAQRSGWVVVARTRGGQNHATEHDKRTQRSASWLPFLPRFPGTGFRAAWTPGQLQKCCSCSMGQYLV